MDRRACLKLALSLFAEHGLIGWDFGFHSLQPHQDYLIGYCDHVKRKITVHGKLVDEGRDPTEVILHEIAHALVGRKHDHDEVSKAKAIQIGATGERWWFEPPSDSEIAYRLEQELDSF